MNFQDLTLKWSGSISSAHMLSEVFKPGHKCRSMHGHNWGIEVEVSCKPSPQKIQCLPKPVIDFGKLKKIVNTYDHAIIMNGEDNFSEEIASRGFKFVLIEGPTTCENLAYQLALDILEELEKSEYLRKTFRVMELSVTAKETEKGQATVTLQTS